MTTHPAHAVFAQVARGLLSRHLPPDVFEVLHAVAKAATASEPLPPDTAALLADCRTWADLARLAAALDTEAGA